jgi:Putative heavy-metal-binding
MRRILVLAALALGGCSTFMDMQDASNPAIVQKATTLPVYMAGDPNTPKNVRIIGPASGNSCKYLPTDPNASETAALQQLRLKALALGATAVVEVRYAHGGTSLATNCWQSVTASGVAVAVQ